MKFINRRFHAFLDYIMGVVLLASPWMFGFADNAVAKWTAMVIGIIMLVTSFITDYEGGFLRVLPMRMHLNLDAIAGMLLIASPWLLNFHTGVYGPHVILGCLELLAAICTSKVSLHDPVPGNIKRESF